MPPTLTVGSVLKYREDVELAGQRGLSWVVGDGTA